MLSVFNKIWHITTTVWHILISIEKNLHNTFKHPNNCPLISLEDFRFTLTLIQEEENWIKNRKFELRSRCESVLLFLNTISRNWVDRKVQSAWIIKKWHPWSRPVIKRVWNFTRLTSVNLNAFKATFLLFLLPLHRYFPDFHISFRLSLIAQLVCSDFPFIIDYFIYWFSHAKSFSFNCLLVSSFFSRFNFKFLLLLSIFSIKFICDANFEITLCAVYGRNTVSPLKISRKMDI